MSNMPTDPGPTAQVRCDEHHWVSTHQPDFPVYWIRQCSLCGYYDPVDMAEQIRRHATTPEQASLKAERDAVLDALGRVRALLGDHDGPLWAVRGVREADICAALEPTP